VLLDQLRRQGISDEHVLSAIARVPRDRVVPESHRDQAWANIALPIGAGQTISQPYIVALMTQSLGLTGHERVLEIGTGSGYQCAILSLLASHVWTIERQEALAARALAHVHALGLHNVSLLVGDGTLGRPAFAPYDRILVTAGAPAIPPPLLDQLESTGGRLVIPIGSRADQRLVAVEKHDAVLKEEDLGPVRFVPLLGKSGWPEETELGDRD
jgi:protein-L-isoaspartate(D-aspartate) O-methyltransferase